MSERALDRLCTFVAFLVPLICYLLTMAGTASFWDSGEFIATSYILGIPHSPGTPLYVLVGRVFSILPLPLSIAQRVNFLSVFFASLSISMLYLIVTYSIRFMYGSAKGSLERFVHYAGPFVGVLYLTFSDSFWRDSTEAEVYSLSAFVMGLCTWLALVWYRNPTGAAARNAGPQPSAASAGAAVPAEVERSVGERAREGKHHSRALVYLMIYLLALGIGFHLGTILVYGAVFLLFILVREKAFGNAELIVFTVGLFVIVADMTLHHSSGVTIVGLLIFALLLVWSTKAKGPFALAATGLLFLGISVHLFLYIRSHLNPAIDEVDPQTWKALYAHLRREQYPSINMFRRKASLLWQFGHFWRYFWQQFRMLGDIRIGVFNIGRAATVIPLGLGLLGIVAQFNRERKTWALNVANLLINSLGLILFLNFSASEVRERDYFYSPAFYFFAVFIGIGATALFAGIYRYARERGREAAGSVVPVALLFIVLSILPARYNWFSHDRHRDYIPRDYAYNMLAGLEGGAIIFTNGDNDTFPLWYIQCVEKFRTDVRVANLSLMKTPWYLREIRDEYPTVPITWSDAEIDALRPVPLRGGGAAWQDDIAVQHIIQNANWKRPIYFSVTVPSEKWQPYADYLEMQGMARRLVPRKGTDMFNEFLVARNFDEIFLYRGVLTKNFERDTTLYRDKATQDAYINFAVAMAQLGQRKGMENDYPEAIRRMRMSLAFDPTFKAAKVLLGTYYLMNDDASDAIDNYVRAIREDPHEGEYWVRLARVYEYQRELPTALDNIDQGIRMAPGYRQLYIDGFRDAAQMGQADLAKSYIAAWLRGHPDDEQLRNVFQGIDKILEEEYGIKQAGAVPPPEGAK